MAVSYQPGYLLYLDIDNAYPDTAWLAMCIAHLQYGLVPRGSVNGDASCQSSTVCLHESFKMMTFLPDRHRHYYSSETYGSTTFIPLCSLVPLTKQSIFCLVMYISFASTPAFACFSSLDFCGSSNEHPTVSAVHPELGHLTPDLYEFFRPG